MNSGLQTDLVLGSVAYSLLGLVLMIVCVTVVNSLFKLNLKKEILDEHNVASAIVLAGIFIAMAIIVASAISG